MQGGRKMQGDIDTVQEGWTLFKGRDRLYGHYIKGYGHFTREERTLYKGGDRH